MSDILSLPSLPSSLSTFHSHTLLPFLCKQQQDLSHLRAEILENTERAQEDVTQAENELVSLQALQASQQQALSSEQLKSAELESSLAAMNVRASSILPAQINNLQKSVQVNEALNNALAKEVASITSIHAREIDAVTRGVDFFRTRLGVSFAVKEGKLQISFAYISKQQPQKQSSVSIFVDENKEYQLHDCTPSIPAVEQLVDQLNSTNNFARFIGQVRKEFVNLENGNADAENKQ